MTIRLLISVASVAAMTLAAGDDSASRARGAVETELRQLSQTPDTVRLRGVSLFRQSRPDTIAVCGQVSPTGAENAFTNFAAVVTTQGGGEVQVRELHLANGPDGTARTDAERFLRCTDEAKRIDTATGAETPPASQASPAAPSPGSPHGLRAGATAVMRQGANLRAGPDTDSPVIRVIPRGTVVHVFGAPQGNWYQIGDTAPWGWMHGSMLAAPSR